MQDRAKKALNKTGWAGVEAAMEWLLSHPEGEDEEEDDEVVVEQQPERAPLTAEEKEAKLKELEERRVQKRQEREEREKEEAIEKEKKRMEDGKAMSKLRQELNDQEIKKLAEERRREKQEAAEAKRKVLEQIEADKRARQMEREAAKKGAAPPVVPAAAPAAPVEKKNYDETKIQIRLVDGSKLEQVFKSRETLSSVRLFVQMNRPQTDTSVVKLMTTFPRKVFTEEDYEKPLEILGLTPSAVIIQSK